MQDVAFATNSSVWADQPSLDRAITDHQTFLERFPPLTAIDRAVREDCAAKSGKRADDPYSQCGAAITFGFFRSSEKQMIPKLQADLAVTGEAGAKEFVNDQGPELYKVCSYQYR